MSSRRLAARISEPTALGVARLADYRLCFNKPGQDGSGKANVVPEAGEAVFGVAFEFSLRELATLDRFEPRYTRSVLDIELEDRTHRAHVYLFDTSGDSGGGEELLPTLEYLEHLIAGACEHALPLRYRETLAIRRASLVAASRTTSGGAAV